MRVMRKARTTKNRRLSLAVVALLSTAAMVLLFRNPHNLTESLRMDLNFLALDSYALRCVQISEQGQSREGIGALFRRNQLAFFLADMYGARVAFPNITSLHGYEVQDLFSRCPPPNHRCVLSQAENIINRCPRADCECHRKNLAPYSTELARRCKVVLVNNDYARTMEYSGCIGGIVKRYLGSTEKETIDYDAIHVRAGDLSDRIGGKAFNDMELYFLLSAMCRMSNRDIVVVTQGLPEIPKIGICEGRLVLASDTSLRDAFRIFQNAKIVSAGASSFGGLMMEVARPMRVVTLARSVNFYEWVKCENWTVIGKRGAVFHFDSKKMMLEAAVSGRDLMYRSFKTDGQFQGTKDKVVVETPPRRWTKDSTWARKA